MENKDKKKIDEAIEKLLKEYREFFELCAKEN